MCEGRVLLMARRDLASKAWRPQHSQTPAIRRPQTPLPPLPRFKVECSISEAYHYEVAITGATPRDAPEKPVGRGVRDACRRRGALGGGALQHEWQLSLTLPAIPCCRWFISPAAAAARICNMLALPCGTLPAATREGPQGGAAPAACRDLQVGQL